MSNYEARRALWSRLRKFDPGLTPNDVALAAEMMREGTVYASGSTLKPWGGVECNACNGSGWSRSSRGACSSCHLGKVFPPEGK